MFLFKAGFRVVLNFRAVLSEPSVFGVMKLSEL